MYAPRDFSPPLIFFMKKKKKKKKKRERERDEEAAEERRRTRSRTKSTRAREHAGERERERERERRRRLRRSGRSTERTRQRDRERDFNVEGKRRANEERVAENESLTVNNRCSAYSLFCKSTRIQQANRGVKVSLEAMLPLFTPKGRCWKTDASEVSETREGHLY